MKKWKKNDIKFQAGLSCMACIRTSTSIMNVNSYVRTHTETDRTQQGITEYHKRAQWWTLLKLIQLHWPYDIATSMQSDSVSSHYLISLENLITCYLFTRCCRGGRWYMSLCDGTYGCSFNIGHMCQELRKKKYWMYIFFWLQLMV